MVKDHTRLYNDFTQLAKTKSNLYPDLPVFVVSHSMGTLVALMSVNLIGNVKAIVFSGTPTI